MASDEVTQGVYLEALVKDLVADRDACARAESGAASCRDLVDSVAPVLNAVGDQPIAD